MFILFEVLLHSRAI